jgi:hypothetical protein
VPEPGSERRRVSQVIPPLINQLAT